MKPAGGTRLLIVLGALSAFGPLSLDMYLPGLPQLTTEFGADPSRVQLTLTACLVGLALGQVIAGPITDRHGRRRPLLCGLAAYAVISGLCAIAPTIGVLTGLRLAQGMAGGFGIVISRAIVSDRYSGDAAGRAFSILMVVNGVAPVLAPLVGGQVLRLGNWTVVFWLLAAIGLVLTTAAALAVGESLPVEDRRSGGLTQTVKGFGGLFRDRWFVGQILAGGLGFSAMMGYISGSPFVLQDLHGLSEQQFSLVFGLNGLGIVAVAQVNRILLRYRSMRQLIQLGQGVCLTGAALLLFAVLTDRGLGFVLPAFFLVVASYGLVAPNIAALALGRPSHAKGAASAGLGLVQYALGGVVAPLVGLGARGSALPTATVIAGCAVLAVLALAVLAPREPVGSDSLNRKAFWFGRRGIKDSA